MISDKRMSEIEAEHATDPIWKWFNRSSHAYWGFASRVAEYFPTALRRVRRSNPILAIAHRTFVFVAGFIIVTPLYMVIGPLVQVGIIITAVAWSCFAGVFGLRRRGPSGPVDFVPQQLPASRQESQGDQSFATDSHTTTMTPEEAEAIYYEFGDALTHQLLTKPERFGLRLRGVSRAGLRKAILMWVAKQRFEGADILYRREMQGGQRVAVLELAQNVWQFTSLFGPLKDGLPVPEPREESSEASRRHDEFVEFLQKLDAQDPNYWQKVEAKLA